MTEIKTFNSAKLFAEQILHPLIKAHTDARLTTRFGAISSLEAGKFPPHQRTIFKCNALKERIILQQTLINEINATILISGSKEENKMLESIVKNLNKLEEDFEDKRDEIMIFESERGNKKPVLTKMFLEINKYLDKTYIQVQRIMTKNKLLFVSSDDGFLEDRDLMDKIVADNLKS